MTFLKRLATEFAASTNKLTEDDVSGDPRHEVYERTAKIRGYNVPVNALTADYRVSGRLLRHRLPHWSKEKHLRVGDQHAHHAKEHEASHRHLVNKSLKDLKAKGVEPGPLISGIHSGKFDENTKNILRHHAHTASRHSGAAFAHYAAAGRRLHTARIRYHSVK